MVSSEIKKENLRRKDKTNGSHKNYPRRCSEMSKKSNSQKRKTPATVNPQGLSEDIADQQPNSQLEQKAKKSNAKR
jgi:small acid-soluble spore protein L (minor)